MPFQRIDAHPCKQDLLVDAVEPHFEVAALRNPKLRLTSLIDAIALRRLTPHGIQGIEDQISGQYSLARRSGDKARAGWEEMGDAVAFLGGPRSKPISG